MSGYLTPFQVVVRSDFTVRPPVIRRMQLMPAANARWAGELVQCAGPGKCRECIREAAAQPRPLRPGEL